MRVFMSGLADQMCEGTTERVLAINSDASASASGASGGNDSSRTSHDISEVSGDSYQ